jgi:hypothetical protein
VRRDGDGRDDRLVGLPEIHPLGQLANLRRLVAHEELPAPPQAAAVEDDQERAVIAESLCYSKASQHGDPAKAVACPPGSLRSVAEATG